MRMSGYRIATPGTALWLALRLHEAPGRRIHARGRIARVGTGIGKETCERRIDAGIAQSVNRQRIPRQTGDIGPHRRANSFTEHVATISLLETWGMVFRRRDSKEKIEKQLERRSAAVLTGDARYQWTHEIPKRASELLIDKHGKRGRVKRSRRISLTFRTTRSITKVRV